VHLRVRTSVVDSGVATIRPALKMFRLKQFDNNSRSSLPVVSTKQTVVVVCTGSPLVFHCSTEVAYRHDVEQVKVVPAPGSNQPNSRMRKRVSEQALTPNQIVPRPTACTS
jgi:precorrin-6B methylase 1